MGKIKATVMGIALAVCLFGSSVSFCNAATSSIDVGVTKTKVWGEYRHQDAGHHLKVTVIYSEKDSKGNPRVDEVSAHQFGNFLSVYVSRPSPDGWQYVNGYAIGYADDVIQAISAMVYAE